jgi:hypothetical protein
MCKSFLWRMEQERKFPTCLLLSRRLRIDKEHLFQLSQDLSTRLHCLLSLNLPAQLQRILLDLGSGCSEGLVSLCILPRASSFDCLDTHLRELMRAGLLSNPGSNGLASNQDSFFGLQVSPPNDCVGDRAMRRKTLGRAWQGLALSKVSRIELRGPMRQRHHETNAIHLFESFFFQPPHRATTTHLPSFIASQEGGTPPLSGGFLFQYNPNSAFSESTRSPKHTPKVGNANSFAGARKA